MLMYLLPEYIDGKGDCCRIGDSDGEHVKYKKLQTIIRNIYKERLKDYVAVKQKTSELLNQKNLIPLFIGPREILIPVKIRDAVVAKDCVYGYINVFQIEKISENSIILKNRKKLPFYDTKKILSRRMKLARTLENIFEDIQGDNWDNIKYRLPATIKDIEVILEELRSIKAKIDELAA